MQYKSGVNIEIKQLKKSKKNQEKVIRISPLNQKMNPKIKLGS